MRAPVTPDAPPERPATEGFAPMRRITAQLASLTLVLGLFPALTLAAPSASGSWIVTLRDGVDPSTTAPALAHQHGGRVGFVYEHAINGFSFRGSQAAADALARNANVLAIEADAEVWLDTTQSNATWGLDRIDQRNLPLSGTYTYERTGAGVTAYVIDSGIRYTHNQFGGRAVFGADLVGGITPAGSDCNGHGTHVSGTIGGSVHGVAKGVKLVSVRVFGCSGGSSWSTIIAGIDWVIGDHDSGELAVANMSLGGGANSSVDAATNNLINDGVATAVAAGNGDFLGRQANACNYSPARVANAMTVSATNSSDTKASWANYGNCVDWFAPGVSITSAWYSSDSATNTISGTSMATPHTAGVAALYLEANQAASPIQVRDAIFANTTKDVVASSSTTNNDLLFSGFIGGSGGGGGDTSPTASFSGTPTSGTAPLTVQFTDSSTGSPTAWAWDFDGNGSTDSTTQHPAFTYTAAGTFSVTLTASNASGSDVETKTGYIVVQAAPLPGSFDLSVDAYKVRGLKHADLAWSGTTATNVDIYRNGVRIATGESNDGTYSETLGKGGGTYTYVVCEAGAMTSCSNEVTVSY